MLRLWEGEGVKSPTVGCMVGCSTSCLKLDLKIDAHGTEKKNAHDGATLPAKSYLDFLCIILGERYAQVP